MPGVMALGLARVPLDLALLVPSIMFLVLVMVGIRFISMLVLAVIVFVLAPFYFYSSEAGGPVHLSCPRAWRGCLWAMLLLRFVWPFLC